MTTSTASGTLLPTAHIEDATDLLLDLTVRQWRTATCDEVVEWVFARLGYTRHLRLSCRADLDTHTWVLQDPDGQWLVYRICAEEFPLPLKDLNGSLDSAWSLLSVDARMTLVLGPMSETFEVLRGATVDDLLLRILAFDDLEDQADMMAIVEWLVEQHEADLEGMTFLLALRGVRDTEVSPGKVPTLATPYPPLTEFGPLLTI